MRVFNSILFTLMCISLVASILEAANGNAGSAKSGLIITGIVFVYILLVPCRKCLERMRFFKKQNDDLYLKNYRDERKN